MTALFLSQPNCNQIQMDDHQLGRPLTAIHEDKSPLFDYLSAESDGLNDDEFLAMADDDATSALDLICGVAMEMASSSEFKKQQQHSLQPPAQLPPQIKVENDTSLAASALLQGKRRRSVAPLPDDYDSSSPQTSRKRKLSESRSYVCPSCPKSFTQQAHLSIHQVMIYEPNSISANIPESGLMSAILKDAQSPLLKWEISRLTSVAIPASVLLK
jgi:hypothetical protein